MTRRPTSGVLAAVSLGCLALAASACTTEQTGGGRTGSASFAPAPPNSGASPGFAGMLPTGAAGMLGGAPGMTSIPVAPVPVGPAPPASNGVGPLVVPDQCDDISLLFVIDGSGSMCERFGAGTRWTELRQALVGPDGVIPLLAQFARFGMLLYDGSIDVALSGMQLDAAPLPFCATFASVARSMATDCTQFIEVPVAPDNATAIANMFPGQQLGGSTPTDLAYGRALQMLVEERGGGADLISRRQYIVLATDGQPNHICVGGTGGNGQVQEAAVLQQVQQASSMGIKTFVVSLASGDARLQTHLDQVAVAGDPMNPAAKTYNPSTPEALVADLKSLLSNALNCELQ